ncbi:hypothetical protein EYW98_20630 [Escherichia coli]|nr:hypothetical protein [Escherichia coli]EGO8379287.1 hypothetical protein [Escherichia coli]
MDEKRLKALVAERAKGLKTEAALNPFSRMLTKLTSYQEEGNPRWEYIHGSRANGTAVAGESDIYP